MTNDDKVLRTHNVYTEAYIGILNTYNNQISTSVIKKNELKEKFFKTTKLIMYSLTVIFSVSMIVSLVLLGFMIWSDSSSVAIITGTLTTLVSSLVTLIMSIYKLPEIIAKYLFNKQEDRLMNEIIKNIQTYEIDAVKSDIENAKLEKFKALSDELDNNEDDNLRDSNYDEPAQSDNSQSDSREPGDISNDESNIS